MFRYTRGQWNPSDAEPTFAEFVQYLINTDVSIRFPFVNPLDSLFTVHDIISIFTPNFKILFDSCNDEVMKG